MIILNVYQENYFTVPFPPKTGWSTDFSSPSVKYSKQSISGSSLQLMWPPQDCPFFQTFMVQWVPRILLVSSLSAPARLKNIYNKIVKLLQYKQHLCDNWQIKLKQKKNRICFQIQAHYTASVLNKYQSRESDVA